MGIALGLGIVFGVRASSGQPTDFLPVLVLLLATAVITRDAVRNLVLIAGLGCLLGGSAGWLRTADATPLLNSAPSGTIAGQIDTDPKTTAAGSTVSFTWIDDGAAKRRSTLFLPPGVAVGRGDRIEVVGTVDGPFGERIFADGVRLREQAGWVENSRRRIRNHLTHAIQRYVPGTPGALTLGLLIGDDSALTAQERLDLRRAGLSHLTAVSGWNVTLVTSAAGLLFLQLGLRGWSWSGVQLLALALFVWIVGPEPPVIRAAIMAVAGLLALRVGRPAHSVTILMLSAAVMVAVSPSALTSLSFQLSVLATLGLIVASRLTERIDGGKAIILTPVVATAVIGLITTPLLAAEFGTISLATIPANLLAAPIVPAATIAGIAVVASGPAGPISMAAGWVAWVLAAIVLWLARVLAAVPYGFHEIAPLSAPTQAGLYGTLMICVVLLLPEGRLMLRAGGAWMCSEPVSAILTASAACVALLTATLAV